MQEVMDEDRTDRYDLLNVGGIAIGDLRYVDDAALISKSRNGLGNLVQVMQEKSTAQGLKMKANKTKVMAVADEDVGWSNLARITVDGSRLKEVEHFQYLGARVENNGDN